MTLTKQNQSFKPHATTTQAKWTPRRPQMQYPKAKEIQREGDAQFLCAALNVACPDRPCGNEVFVREQALHNHLDKHGLMAGCGQSMQTASFLKNTDGAQTSPGNLRTKPLPLCPSEH